MQSLWNKTEELATLVKSNLNYYPTSLFCFTETLLFVDADFHLDCFNIIHFDRDAVRTQKSIGGMLCMAV